jgi:hypothetical protein
MEKYENIQNKVGIVISRDYPGNTAQTATNYGYIFTAPFPFEVLSIVEKHDVAGNDASAVTLDIFKVPNGTTLASGTSILVSTFDLKSTADTAVLKQGLELNSSRGFKPFDSIALKTTGTLTTLEGVQITIYIKPLNMGDFRNYGQ